MEPGISERLTTVRQARRPGSAVWSAIGGTTVRSAAADLPSVHRLFRHLVRSAAGVCSPFRTAGDPGGSPLETRFWLRSDTSRRRRRDAPLPTPLVTTGSTERHGAGRVGPAGYAGAFMAVETWTWAWPVGSSGWTWACGWTADGAVSSARRASLLSWSDRSRISAHL